MLPNSVKPVLLLGLVLTILIQACAASTPPPAQVTQPAPPTSVPTVIPTYTPSPTDTAVPTQTPVPPTATTAPTVTQTLTPTIPESDCSKPEVLCVGLVTDVNGMIANSFNQYAWEGVQQAQVGLGALVNYIQTTDSADYRTNIVSFATRGYDVIVTVGFGLAAATTSAAQYYPGVYFIGVDQLQSAGLPNLVGLVFQEDKAGFMAGALAALMTRTNTVAGVYGSDLQPVVAFHDGFHNGALYINPDITVISTYHPRAGNAFSDPGWGAIAAAEAIQKGADVIFGAGGQTGNGAIIETASHAGLYCIGVDADQWLDVPEAHPCLISSAMKLLGPGVFALIQAFSRGDRPAGIYYGQVGLAPFHDFETLITKSIRARLVEVTTGLNDGSISTGYTAP